MTSGDSGPRLEQWVVYRDHPAYPPGWYVVRCWRIGPGELEVSPEVWIRPTLADARRVIAVNYPGAYRLDRDPGDDRTVVEVWI